MVLEDLELISKFKNLYCLHTVIDSVECEVREYILKSLPLDIAGKIHSINIISDPDNFLVVDINVGNDDANSVYMYLHKRYPVFEWVESSDVEFTNISLRLDDDVISSLPQFLYDSV